MIGESIGIKTNSVQDLILKLRRGLPVSTFDRLKANLAVPEKELASMVNIAHRTLTRRKREGRLKADESERVLRLAKLYERAVDVFEDKELAQKWFHMKVKGLGGETPLDYSDTELGAQEVDDLLTRIEHGVVS